jgi:hypothetical protein
LFGQRSEAQVGFHNLEVGEELFGKVVVDRGVDNDIVSGHPIDGSCDAVLVARLQRIDNAQHLGGVAARRRGVGEDEADGLLGVDNEDGADGKGDALGVDVGGILMVDPSTKVSTTLASYTVSSQLTCRRPARPGGPCRR